MKQIITKSTSILYFVTLILLVVNVVVIFLYPLDISRIVKLGSTSIIFLFFLWSKGYSSKILFGALFFLLLKDVLITNYEQTLFKTSSFLCTIAAYGLIIFYAIRFLSVRFFQKEIFVFVVLLLGLNIFNLYYMSDVVLDKLDNDVQHILFYIQGAIILFMGLVAYLYNDAYVNKGALMYLYLVICLICADLSGLVAYFFDFKIAFYPQKIFHILGFAMVVYLHMIEESGDQIKRQASIERYL